MANWTILGSGFGLYGYLPAILEGTQNTVYLNIDKKSKFNRRDELRKYSNRIVWLENQDQVFNIVDSVCMAVVPEAQERFINSILSYSNIVNIILEKPIARKPEASVRLLDACKSNAVVKVRVGYTLLEAYWFETLLVWASRLNAGVEINWKFKAHHLKHEIDNWKGRYLDGGGIVRFYGIHIIAMAAVLGFEEVVYSKLNNAGRVETTQWNCRLKNAESKTLDFAIDIDSNDDVFSIAVDSENIVCDIDPFGDGDIIGQDPRIGCLKKIISSLKKPAKIREVDYKVIALWSRIEKKTVINYIGTGK